MTQRIMKHEMSGKDYRGKYSITIIEPDAFSEFKHQLQITTGVTDDDYDETIHVNMSEKKLKELRDMIDNILNNTELHARFNGVK